METTTRANLRSAVRTLVFGLLGVAMLYALVAEKPQAAAKALQAKKAALFVRGGDTFLGLYYLAHGAGWPEEESEWFLQSAHEFYARATTADPTSFRARLSSSMWLRAAGFPQQAAETMPPVIVPRHSAEERQVLRSVFAIVGTIYPAPLALEKSHDYLFTYGPGPLMLSRAYREMDRREQADQIMAEAARQWRPLLYRVLAAVVFNGLIVLAGIVGLVVALFRRARFEPAPLGRKPWGLREATEALLLWVAVGGLLGMGVAGAALGDKTPVWLILLPSLLAGALAIDWVWIAARFEADLGWVFRNARRHVLIGVCAAGLVVMPALAIQQVFLYRLGRSPLDNPTLPLLATPDLLTDKLALLVLAGLLVPVLEETLFRGVIFGAFRRQWSFWPAAVASAALFSLLHMDLAGAVSLFLLGLVFALLFERTRSLVAPAAAHAAFNLFNLAVILTLFG